MAHTYTQYRKKGGAVDPEDFELQSDNFNAISKGGTGYKVIRLVGLTSNTTEEEGQYTCLQGERIINIKAMGNGLAAANFQAWDLTGFRIVTTEIEDGDELRGSFLKVKSLDNSDSPVAASEFVLTIATS